jgi:hypothetical protein
MARTLSYLCVAALALGLSGCNFATCTQKPSTDLQALALALLCFGANYPGVNDAGRKRACP